VSLLTHDLKAAQLFYGELLGWDFRPGWQGEDRYTVAHVDGMAVAGLGRTAESAACPVAWTVFFGAADVHEVAQSCRENGATVGVGPLEYGKGRVAWASDPAGAGFALWEGDVSPAWRVDRQEPGPVWLELRTRDAFDAARFYGAVFGWDAGGPVPYDVRFEVDRVVLRIGGRPVAGMFGGAVEAAPDPQVRPGWQTYFCVDDVDEVVGQAAGLGGTVIAGPGTSPHGRVAVLRDAEGGMFGLASLTP
jgi:predicted enzyme related to lactoylglutathione lyase